MATIHPDLFIFLLLLSSAVAVRDTLTTGRPLFENETLISASAIFAFGFFTPNATTGNRYLAVWYHSIPSHDVVWVANSRNPIPPLAFSPFLLLSPNATLSLFATTNTASRPTLIWSSPSASANGPTDAARLLDTGNLIIQSDSETPIWQSFDYPSDTILPGMFIGSDFHTGLSTNITSWSSPTDPTPGAYVTSLDLHGVPQLIVRKSITGGGARVYWRGGPWLGNRFAGVPEVPAHNIVGITFVDSADRVGYYSKLGVGRAGSLLTRFKAISDGTAQRLVWLDPPGQWQVFWRTPKDQCDLYSPCGPFGICNAGETPLCSCPTAFRPKNPPRWALRDASDGCVRTTSLGCQDPHVFLTLPGVKLPDTSAASAHGGLGLDGCRARCLSNCSCTAYSLADITGSCILWAGTLDDMRFYSAGGQDLYVRVAAADVVVSTDKKSTSVAAIVAPVVGGLIAAVILIGCLLVRCSKSKKGIGKCMPILTPLSVFMFFYRSKSSSFLLSINRDSRTVRTKFDEAAKDRDIDLPLFDFEVVADATDNFSEENKLGEGGFGPVFKGRMKDGKELAVKRLSNSSTQGTDEFKNEVLLIAKLQHRNLVLLLGCCIQRQERILIYEYMPNKSLDTFLFDDEKKMLLNWQMRYHIMIGIARGLLYLHQDSVVRVIHRDLKASNILLNQEMVPKISDFGLARIFGGEDAKSKTKRVVGTYGYMSPEYLMDGIFSVKSDVFSFGVIVLEVISNQRNRGFSNSESNNHLLEQAWSLWKEDKALELVDESIGNTFSVDEVLRCIKVGLLCVQERPNDRPSMSSVFLMMTSDKEVLPEPKCPGFVAMRHTLEASSSDSSKQEIESENVVTLTMPHGR